MLQRRENNSSPRATTSSNLDSGAPYVITQTQGWGYASDGTMDLLWGYASDGTMDLLLQTL